jgi:hypothetical protein
VTLLSVIDREAGAGIGAHIGRRSSVAGCPKRAKVLPN